MVSEISITEMKSGEVFPQAQRTEAVVPGQGWRARLRLKLLVSLTVNCVWVLFAFFGTGD